MLAEMENSSETKIIFEARAAFSFTISGTFSGVCHKAKKKQTHIKAATVINPLRERRRRLKAALWG
jgi:hypothetical protein